MPLPLCLPKIGRAAGFRKPVREAQRLAVIPDLVGIADRQEDRAGVAFDFDGLARRDRSAAPGPGRFRAGVGVETTLPCPERLGVEGRMHDVGPGVKGDGGERVGVSEGAGKQRQFLGPAGPAERARAGDLGMCREGGDGIAYGLQRNLVDRARGKEITFALADRKGAEAVGGDDHGKPV